MGGDEWHDPLKRKDPMQGDGEFSALRWCFAALCWRDGAIKVVGREMGNFLP